MPHEVVTVEWEGRPVGAFVPAPLSDAGELGAAAGEERKSLMESHLAALNGRA